MKISGRHDHGAERETGTGAGVNYLVHLYLSDPGDDCRLGNYMADFVKGPLPAHYPDELRRGLWQHRRIDAFAQDSPACRRSRKRIAPHFGHYRGILVDVFYDHLLARDWTRFHHQPLEVFAAEIRTLLRCNLHRLPRNLQPATLRMVQADWLLGYRDPGTIGRVLERLSRRVPRVNPLAAGLPELLRERDALAADCAEFLTEAKAHLARTPFKGDAQKAE